MYKVRNLCILGLMLGFASMGSSFAKTKESSSEGKGAEKTQRAVSGTFDLQKNRVSRVEFYSTNYGIIGLDVANNVGGGKWPRGTNNQYIFGGGIWFGVKKLNPQGDTVKLCDISYNPNSGSSWMVPGRIEEDQDAVNDANREKYRLYFSSDYRRSDGTALKPADGSSPWPIWDLSANPLDTLRKDRYFGGYEDNVGLRTVENYPKGPAFISGEDIFATFKDTDLNRYEGGVGRRKSEGYPLRIQYEQMIYSWGFGDYRDFLFIKYALINKSKDTLRECWLAPAFDMDIGVNGSTANYAANDRTRYYNEEDTLNLAIQWSNGTQGEAGKGFGYIGFDFLESPSTYPAFVVRDTVKDANGNDSIRYQLIGTSPDSAGFLRKDKKVYTNREQLGLKTFRNWTIDQDPKENDLRYDFMALGLKDGDTPEGDKRFLMATGPFNLAPKDTARTVVGLIMANTPNGNDANGRTEDAVELIKRDKFAQRVYDDNFRTPTPPDPSKVNWRPLNNAVIVTWDTTAEYSYDDLEKGLDFMGYKLYRARRIDLDSFDTDVRKSIARGPFGWKQLAEWKMPTPFSQSTYQTELDDQAIAPYFDSIQIVKQVDSFTFKVRRFINGSTRKNPFGNDPWNQLFSGMSQAELDSILTGTLIINRASTQNPPRWSKTTDLPWPSVTTNGKKIFLPIGVRTSKSGFTSSFSATDSTAYDTFFPALMTLLRKNLASLAFNDLEPNADMRKKIRRDIIRPYMAKITNNATFVDNGDDNKDGKNEENEDLTKTERLLNNIDYYYWLSAFDEGDYRQATPKKFNSGIEDLNIVKSMPLAAAARTGSSAKIQIVSADTSNLGGLFNFRFPVKDEDRLNQLFTTDGKGHDLEIEFNPEVSMLPFPLPSAAFSNPPEYGVYGTKITIRDLTTNKTLYNAGTWLEQNLCARGFLNTFTENGSIYVFADSVIVDSISGKADSFGVPDNKEKRLRTGTFTTERVNDNTNCYNALAVPDMKNAFDFGFDYSIQQSGGMIRYDTAFAMAPSGANTHVTFPSQDLFPFAGSDQKFDTILTAYPSTTNPVGGVVNSQGFLGGSIYNNGPGDYTLEFLPGGDTTITALVGTAQTPKTFTTKYLNVRVINNYNYKRPADLNSSDSTTIINNNYLVHYTDSSAVRTAMPVSKKVPIGQFNIATAGFVNGRGTVNSVTSRRDQSSGLVSQGKYLLSANNGTDLIDFVHVVNVDGNFFGLDYVNKGYGADTRARLWDTIPNVPSKDFAAGDKAVLRTFGGAAGFPMPGTKIRAKVIPSVPSTELYTDQMLEDVKIVPNPYYVSHQAQKSPYDAKLYFTRLPKDCKITIFTPSGEIVRTLTHSQLTPENNDRYGMDVWDLLTSNRQRVGSSVYIAQVETPNGAKAFIKFAVVVGGFRVIPE